jgi:hypothetical protein
MKQLNSVIVEGAFKHYTSKKGALPLTFIVDCDGQNLSIAVKSEQMAKVFVSNKPSNIRVVGRLERNGKNVCISAEHIEFKKDKGHISC